MKLIDYVRSNPAGVLGFVFGVVAGVAIGHWFL